MTAGAAPTDAGRGPVPPRVAGVRRRSPCAGKVRKGDLLLEISGTKPRDVIDYLQAADSEEVTLRLRRGGRELTRGVRKRAGVPLGLVFEDAVFDGVITCRNQCLFCFVDQMPPGMRPSLYVKDDDYRLSFLHGNFITLNNLSAADMKRILGLRLSPLYVSLHSTDADLRSRLMGGDAGRGLATLRELLRAGIEVHLQVVVCPGINDGEALLRTFHDVLEEYPAASLGAVPLGLTSRGREEWPELVPHDRASAREVLGAVRGFQGRALERHGRRLFFAADEFYLLAEEDFPPAEDYEGYPQLENGVGMARRFLDQAAEAAEAAAGKARGRIRGRRRGVVTGRAGAPVLSSVLERAGLEEVEMVVADNTLFGPLVTVTSLLSGADIAAALLARRPPCRELLIPATLLREGRFIDDLTPEDVRQRTGYALIPVEVDGRELLRLLGTGR